MYYASVHGISNVLQYYPFGIQSYPLEASRLEKASGVYVGNIPSLPSPPTNPAIGFVYYDKNLELSSKDLLSQNENGTLDESILELIKTEYKDWFEVFENKVSIKDKALDIEAIIKWLFYEKNRLMPDYDSDPDKYKNFYWIIIVLHNRIRI